MKNDTMISESAYDTSGAVCYTVVVVCWYSIGLIGILYNRFRSELKTAQVVYALKKKQSLKQSSLSRTWWRSLLQFVVYPFSRLYKAGNRRVPVIESTEQCVGIDPSTPAVIQSSLLMTASNTTSTNVNHNRTPLFESDYEHLRVLETLADVQFRTRAWNAYFNQEKIPAVLQFNENATMSQIRKRMNALQFDIAMQSRIRHMSLTSAANQFSLQSVHPTTTAAAGNSPHNILMSKSLKYHKNPLFASSTKYAGRARRRSMNHFNDTLCEKNVQLGNSSNLRSFDQPKVQVPTLLSSCMEVTPQNMSITVHETTKDRKHSL